jgi:hypothetical protein
MGCLVFLFGLSHRPAFSNDIHDVAIYNQALIGGLLKLLKIKKLYLHPKPSYTIHSNHSFNLYRSARSEEGDLASCHSQSLLSWIIDVDQPKNASSNNNLYSLYD